MAAIAVGEREEWTAPRRVKPVNRERAPAFSAALTPRGALPERIETQGLALEEPLFAAWNVMQRTEAPWSSGLIERTTCQSRAGSNLFAAVTVHPGLSLNYLIFGHSLNARFGSLARPQKIRIGDLWRLKQRRVGTLPR